MYCDTIAIFSPSCPFTHTRYLTYLTEILMYACMSRRVCTRTHTHTHTHTTKHTWGEGRVRGVRVDILTFFVCFKTNPIGTIDHKFSQCFVLQPLLYASHSTRPTAAIEVGCTQQTHKHTKQSETK